MKRCRPLHRCSTVELSTVCDCQWDAMPSVFRPASAGAITRTVFNQIIVHFVAKR